MINNRPGNANRHIRAIR